MHHSGIFYQWQYKDHLRIYKQQHKLYSKSKIKTKGQKFEGTALDMTDLLVLAALIIMGNSFAFLSVSMETCFNKYFRK